MTKRANYVLAGLGLLVAFVLGLASMPAMANGVYRPAAPPSHINPAVPPGVKPSPDAIPCQPPGMPLGWCTPNRRTVVAQGLVTGDIVRIPPPHPLVAPPSATPDVTQYQHDLAAQAAEIARLKAKPPVVAVSYNAGGASHAKSAMDLDMMKGLLSGDSDVAWNNNFRTTRAQFITDVARALGVEAPKTISDFVTTILNKAVVSGCPSTKKTLKIDTAGRTSPFGKKCSEDEGTTLYFDGKPFWWVDEGTMLVSRDVVREVLFSARRLHMQPPPGNTFFVQDSCLRMTRKYHDLHKVLSNKK